MRIIAVLLLSLTVACTTDRRGLGGIAGSGGTATGNGGSTNVGGAPGMGGALGMAGTIGTGGAAGTVVTGGTVGTAGTGAGGVGGSDNGQTCTQDGDCKSGHCIDRTCCSTACTGSCRSCANSTGTCALAAAMSDPRGDCAADSQNPCGNVGYCDGSGACALASAGIICNSAPTCDSSKASVIATSICNGAGACIPGSPVSCNGFSCTSGACNTACSDDSACAQGGFCSAQACIGTPNLAGNGDLETGTLTGWSSFGGAGSLILASPAASGYAHAGQFSAGLSGRTQDYQGPSYSLPTGLGRYSISVWAMQTQDTNVPPTLIAQIRLLCLTSSSYLIVQMAGFGMSAPAGTWIQFAADVDMKAEPGVGPDCVPDGTNGAVRSATLFIDEVPDASPSPNPDLYVDDLVVQSTDGHNLIGNPNFEAGVIDGWSTLTGSSLLSVSSTVAHGGQRSLWQAARSLPTSAVAYALPTGAARYAVSLWALQSGTMAHQLALLPLYSCIGSSAIYFGAPSAVTSAPGGEWTELTGTFAFPPANAPAGCVLSQASVAVGQAETGVCGSILECPDLFVDDASITLK